MKDQKKDIELLNVQHGWMVYQKMYQIMSNCLSKNVSNNTYVYGYKVRMVY